MCTGELCFRCRARERRETELVSDACHKNNRKKSGVRGRTAAQITFSLLDKPSTVINVMFWQVSTANDRWNQSGGYPRIPEAARGLHQTPLADKPQDIHNIRLMSMTSLQVSSLESMEDRRSILLKLEDVEKRLIEIEDNTHPDRGNRSNFRHKRKEKVG